MAKSQATPPHALENIATLITNIFEVGGSEGRKTALSSGFLDLIIKLLHTRDPIPVRNVNHFHDNITISPSDLTGYVFITTQ